MARFFHLAYPAPPRPDRDWRIHELRDDAPLVEIMPVLIDAGLRWGGKILSIHPPQAVSDLEPEPGDLVVLTTRPPLSEDLSPDKKHARLRPGGGQLETRVFRQIKRYLRECHRGGVALEDAVADRLVHKQYGTMQFYVNQMTAWATLKRGDNTTSIGFVLRILPSRDCPGVLCVFGMNGPASLVFSRLVASRLPHLLLSPGLSIIEMKSRRIPSNPPSLHFAENLRYDVILDRQALAEGEC